MFGKSFLSPIAASLLIAGTFAAAPVSAAIVTNGGFETGDFTGWKLTSNAVLDGGNANAFVISDAGVPQSGTYGASFGFLGSPGGISQTLATSVGVTYTVDFWLRDEADPLGVSVPNSFQFTWNGSSVKALTNVASFDYQHFTYSLTATAASTVISFLFRNDPAFWDLDNVSVVANVTAVPEPETWAFMGLGLAALAARRKRAHSAR